MKALIDTCVIIDHLQNREPFAAFALRLLEEAAQGKFEAFVTAKSLSDIYYILRRHLRDKKVTLQAIQKLLGIVGILDTTAQDCMNAMYLDINDFEDAIMAATADRTGMDYLVTRNLQDYVHAPVKCVDVKELLRIMGEEV